MIRMTVLCLGALALAQPAIAQSVSRGELEAMAAAHAHANGVPVALVHRVIMRESRYRPHVVGKGGAMGLMQIKTATARGVGYTGSARGLLDPDTNLKYAVKYLAGAYLVAGGDHDRAVMYYARGYYYAAKRKGLLDELSAQTRQAGADSHAEIVAPTPAARQRGASPDVFSRRDEIIQ